MKECKVIDENFSSVELQEVLNELYSDNWVVSKIKKITEIHAGHDQLRNKRYNYFILLERDLKQ